MTETTITMQHSNDEEIVTRVQKKSTESMAPFMGIAKLRCISNPRITEPDPYDILVSLPAGAGKLFIELKCKLDLNTNLIYHPSTNMSRYEQKTFFKYLVPLKDANIIKRVKSPLAKELFSNLGVSIKTGTFMLNPAFAKSPVRYKTLNNIWNII